MRATTTTFNYGSSRPAILPWSRSLLIAILIGMIVVTTVTHTANKPVEALRPSVLRPAIRRTRTAAIPTTTNARRTTGGWLYGNTDDADTAASASDDTSRPLSATEALRQEAETLQLEAEQLRAEIKEATVTSSPQVGPAVVQSPWTVVPAEDDDDDDDDRGSAYRLYIDIGREEGSWMDPRWGASGKRLEFAVDIQLVPTQNAADGIAAKMVDDNSFGQRSATYMVRTAPYARLRDGFDKMACTEGAYRIDINKKKNQATFRMVLEVAGTTQFADQQYIYGDVSVPGPGCLYFSLPCFVNATSGTLQQISTKEGLVSVRKMGWHTGWRREESQICGVFTAKTLAEAQKRDPY